MRLVLFRFIALFFGGCFHRFNDRSSQIFLPAFQCTFFLFYLAKLASLFSQFIDVVLVFCAIGGFFSNYFFLFLCSFFLFYLDTLASFFSQFIDVVLVFCAIGGFLSNDLFLFGTAFSLQFFRKFIFFQIIEFKIFSFLGIDQIPASVVVIGT